MKNKNLNEKYNKINKKLEREENKKELKEMAQYLKEKDLQAYAEKAKTIVSRKDIGFGKYAYYINGVITEKSEVEIIDLIGKKNEKRFFSLLNYYGNFDIEI